MALDVRLDAFEECQQASHTHNFREHPQRKISVMVAVFGEKVLFENFLAPVYLLLQGRPPFKLFRNLELRQFSVVAITERSMSMGKMINQLRSDRDFDPLNAVQR